MAENKKKKESLSFQAEVSKLLDIVANSLYSEREIFLRELISNSADACEKLRYLAITKKGLLGNQKEFSIRIRLSKKKKIFEIEDNGIGMNRQDLIDNLGTIARSGSKNFLSEQLVSGSSFLFVGLRFFSKKVPALRACFGDVW